MPNEAGAARAICPYYRTENICFIQCEGLVKDTSTRMVFASEMRKADWQKKACSSFGYEQACPLAAALTARYERKEGIAP